MSNLITRISELLKSRNIIFEIRSENELLVPVLTEGGFEIFVEQSDREHTLHFGNWHFHFDSSNDEENKLIDYFGYGLSELGRLKVFSKSGKEYKWTFETRNELNEDWMPFGTTGSFNLKFWIKPEIKYLQNKIIPITD